MDIGKSFGFVFEDKNWIEKILIGGILMLIPILGPILMLGYSVELVRNVRKHEMEPLPRWDNWGEKIADGFKLFIIYILWSLPLIILSMVIVIPLAFAGNSDTGSAIASIFSLCFSCFAFIYAIVVWLATPGITIKFAETGEFSDGLKFGEILNFTKEHLGQIFVVIVVSWLIYMLAGLIGTLLCLIGLVFTMFWASLVQYHMIAQIGLEPEAPERPLETLSETKPAEELPETSQSNE
jgi:hypothetical protein